jgi:RecA-family ATPase
MENIMTFAGPKFTMSVKTGTTPYARGHAYWQLDEPCYNLQAWREVQKSIAASLQTDAAVVNPSRIMRVAGTVSWPNQKKQDKGYVPELVTMRTEFSTDREPVEFDRLMRAFPKKPEVASSIEIDLGQQAMDRQLAVQNVLADKDWHTNVLRLVGSYVTKGLSDEEIHSITDGFTLAGYTVEDTRQEVQRAIDGARNKGWTPEPDPIKERIEAQNEALSEVKAKTWPTPYSMFNALTLPRREWVYGYDYIKKYISVTASAGGIGKTSLTVVEALAIATGKDLLDVPVRQQTNVWKAEDVQGKLFMDGEDDIQITLAAEGRDGLITNDDLLQLMTDKIKQNNIGVVIIDPFVSAHLVNENNNGSIQAVVAMLRKLARDTDSSIQLVHHIRKTNGDDATIDSVRGAGSLIGAARAARVINRVSMDDAMALGVDEHESLGIFRVDDGKANLAPPADKCIYRRMHSVEIANGEHIGVATSFTLPDLFDGVTTKDALEVQRKVAEAEKNDNPYRMSVQAKNWIGLAVCKQLNLDVEKKNEKTKAKKIVEQWISTKVLKQVEVPDKRQGRDVQGVVVGEWISAE